MGSIMNWVRDITHRAEQRQQRTEKLQQISQMRQDINDTSDAIRSKVREYQSTDDPLQALMHTLRTTRGH